MKLCTRCKEHWLLPHKIDELLRSGASQVESLFDFGWAGVFRQSGGVSQKLMNSDLLPLRRKIGKITGNSVRDF